MKAFVIPCLFLLLVSCNNPGSGGGTEEPDVISTPLINYVLVATLPHDTTSFTEGLLFHNGLLYESTGASSGLSQTRSLFGVVDSASGAIRPKVELDAKKYFGEGIAFLNSKVYQLTYQTKVGFVYDTGTFRQTGQFIFPSDEGWGMTTDGASLIMSDGTSQLTWLDPVSFGVRGRLTVKDANGAVDKLNELEYINGSLYANIYTTSKIVRIDPATGIITGQLDLSSLANEAHARYEGSMEMNGIAYDPRSRSLYVTGKMWPVIYTIRFAGL